MKNILFRYYSRFFALAMLLGSMSVHAQTIIYKTDQQSEHLIIRNYKDDIEITYNVICADISFDYVNRNAMTTRSVSLPSNIVVNDFAVYHDSVFFCGMESVGYNRYAIYGYFDINSVFFSSSGSIQYFRLDYTPYDTNACVIGSLLKIDVKRCASGDLHMVMTGSGLVYNANTRNQKNAYYYTGMVVDAWIEPSTANVFKYSLNTDSSYVCDDVTLIDNYAVVAARGANGMHNVFFYKEPIIPSQSYFDSWTATSTANVPLWQADPATLLATDRIHITKMKQNMFATVCSTSLPGNQVVSFFSNPWNPPVRFVLPYNDHIREIVYNKVKESLFILTNSYSFLEYVQNPFLLTARIIADWPGWISIDNTESNAFEILSGIGPYCEKKYWRYNGSNQSSCISYEDRENEEMGVNETDGFLEQTIDRIEVIGDNNSCSITNFILSVLCE